MGDQPNWTPGPWLIGEDQCVDETWSIVTTTGGSVISNVNDRHDRLANVHLIAAAPDLYAALEAMIYETTHLSGERDDGSHRCFISKSALTAARAALAKARGQA